MTTMEKIRLMELVRELSDSEWNEFKAELLKSGEDEVKENPIIEVEIQKLMFEVGIPANIRGYKYLKEAILLVMENPTMIGFVTKKLYPTVAMHFDTTPAKVERAMRHAIEVAWDRGKFEKLEEIFGNTVSLEKGMTSNSQFIAGIVEYINHR